MPHDVETLRITVWVLAAIGLGLVVYLAHCLDVMAGHNRAIEAELEALRMERWARERDPRGLVTYPVPHGDDDHRWN